MHSRQLTSLKSKLSEAKSGSPDSVKTLARAVTRLEDKAISVIILKVLNQLSSQACIDVVCQVWVNTRHQTLANLLVKNVWVASKPVEIRVLSALKTKKLAIVTGGGKEIVEVLLEALKDRDAEIAKRAKLCAIALTNADAINYLCQEWAVIRDRLLTKIICHARYVAIQPVEVRVLTALKVGKRQAIAKDNAAIIEPLLQACQNSELAIAAEARKLLGELKNQSAIDVLCIEWAKTRKQHLTDALQCGQYVATQPVEIKVLTALKNWQLEVIINGGEEIVEPLLGAFKDKDAEIANRAKLCALVLTNTDAIDYLCHKWAKTRDGLLEQIICQARYIARQPVEVKVLTALKLEQLESIDREGAEVLEPLFQAYQDADPTIAKNVQIVLRDLKNPAARDRLCYLAIEQKDRLAWEIAITSKYAPRDPNQRALFYFLTEQWDEYESLDYKCTLLQNIYELADNKLRKRIADIAKQAGRMEWVSLFAEARKGKQLGEMTDAEWETTLAVLTSIKQWEKMWQLAQKAPAIWSKQLLQRLNEVGWVPKVEEEREIFERLKQLADKCPAQIPSMGKLMCSQGILFGHTGLVKVISFSPDGKLLTSCSNNETIRLWQMPNGKSIAKVLHNGSVKGVTFSPDGKLLASCSDKQTIRLWQMPDCRHLSTLTGYVSLVNGVSFRIAPVYGVSFSPDGKLLASCEYGQINLWYMPDIKCIKRCLCHDREIYGVTFDPDGKLLASCSDDQTIRLWQMPEGELLATLIGHTGSVNGVAFSPDGKLLAGCSDDQTIRLWQMPEGELLATLIGHTGSVNGVAFSPDGKLLAGCSDDQTIRLWSLLDLLWLYKLPIGQLNQQDRESIQKLLPKKEITQEKQHWLKFIQALIDWHQHWHRRFDVEVEDAPQLVSNGEFDIEIEG